MRTDTPSPADLDAIQVLLSRSVHNILAHEDPQQYLDWLRTNAAVLVPELIAMTADDVDLRRGLLYGLGRAIWNATPLPGNQFRPRLLAKPERNAPCPCGSGAKFKHCCGQAHAPELPLDQESMLCEVLQHWPASRYKQLPFAHLSVTALAVVANGWVEAGDAGRAVKLLEPLFADLDRLDERADYAFDTLAQAYSVLNKPRKKEQLIERVSTARAPALRVAALQRQCTILSDRGRHEEALQLFQQAQRLLPNDPSFSHLEILLLMNTGRKDEAKQRARFWIARLRREDAVEHAELIRFLEEMAADPDQAILELGADNIPGLAHLLAFTESLAGRAVQPFYTLGRGPENAVMLKPNAVAEKLLTQWRHVMPPLETNLVDVTPMGPYVWAPEILVHWQDFLDRHPQAFDVLEILDDIVLALHQLDQETSMWGFNAAAEPLLCHARAVLETALRANTDTSRALPWIIWENRPALRLMANLIFIRLDQERLEDAVSLMEWLVFTLNPNDNHGLRELLSTSYLRLNRDRDVLAVQARYPDDAMAAMSFNRVLALYRLGEHEQAQEALREARGSWPTVYQFLQAEKPRQPRLTPGRVAYQGKDEAWYYREDHLALWRDSGALAWLKQQAAPRGKR